MNTITILNFSHPLTKPQLTAIAAAVDREIGEVKSLPAQFDVMRSFAEQMDELIAEIGWDVATWQTQQFLVNLPALHNIAGVLLARLHGLMGHFPTIIVLRRKPNVQITEFELAEIIDLNSVRIRAAAS